MDTLSSLFAQNRHWAESITQEDPEFFQKLSLQQQPQYLWIGCSDSRVPANEIIGLLPGEVFVHRNIANVVVHTDLNCLSVIQFAVDVLKVKHIMVVGHYGCGGVKAAYRCQRVGLADNWLRHVQDVRGKHDICLCTLPDEDQRMDRLCELNIIEQVSNVCQTTIVRDAWDRGQELTVHGWIYSLKDGLLRDQHISASSVPEAETAYRTAIAEHCGNLPLCEAIRRCWSFKRVSYEATDEDPKLLAKGYEQHLVMLDALAAHDQRAFAFAAGPGRHAGTHQRLRELRVRVHPRQRAQHAPRTDQLPRAGRARHLAGGRRRRRLRRDATQ